ncbi:hypothetical protein QC763_0051940 [Podospora pseudopauciseta]|uniref:Uncharacterized protein n=1 Tax=Podospora pseudopauciseta TaxID=2093780 RepID=A0ABR0HFX9_9PEZI|nr:hypothetical protein QC763_0051940 [Podospora pseudopauciseta]
MTTQLSTLPLFGDKPAATTTTTSRSQKSTMTTTTTTTTTTTIPLDISKPYPPTPCPSPDLNGIGLTYQVNLGHVDVTDLDEERGRKRLRYCEEPTPNDDQASKRTNTPDSLRGRCRYRSSSVLNRAWPREERRGGTGRKRHERSQSPSRSGSPMGEGGRRRMRTRSRGREHTR